MSAPAAAPSRYLPPLDVATLRGLQARAAWEALLEAIVEPLHEELYRRQDFDFLDELSAGQQLLLSFDYIRHQVHQGGFIQLIQNNYIGLVLPLPEQLIRIGADAMAEVLDDVLKVYVLNIDSLGRETTVEEFAKLYDEFQEFESLEKRYNAVHEETLRLLGNYALEHLSDFTISR